MSAHAHNRAITNVIRALQYDMNLAGLREQLAQLAPEARFHHCYPFGDFDNSDDFVNGVFEPLVKAMPDIERRDFIVMAGTTPEGADWVGCGGHYLGTFTAPWLDIPPTGHMAHFRFHEFWRFEDRRIVEWQCLWDIPELMLQANAWPLAPSLGRELMVPGPASCDGIQQYTDPSVTAAASDKGAESCQLIIDMLTHMKRHPSGGGPEVMEMERFWHPRMNWYGPAGIGSCRGIEGFRNWHQIPFLKAMPDRGQYLDEITYHFFGEDNYAAVTGWPNMIQTLSHDGWLGIAPTGQRLEMRSLDFWRMEHGLIRENWVLVDLLHVYDQLGIDVFARLREFNKARGISA